MDLHFNEVRIKIVKLVQTCVACPSQWDGWTGAAADDPDLYFRYRNGILRVEITSPVSAAADEDWITIFSCEYGESYNGVLSVEELQKLTNHIIDWSSVTIESIP